MKLNKKLVVPALIVLFILIVVLIVKKPGVFKISDSLTPTPTQVAENLPNNWQKVDNTADVVLKYEKTVDSGLKPQIVMAKSELPADTTFEKYTNSLIAGAKSTLPSLKYSQDSLQDNLRLLSGSYRNSNKPVSVIQRVYLRNQTVYTLTGSYDPSSSTVEEINTILDSIVSQHLPN